jgi:8-oxo-dGTP pyrophosphatase MutT (NUDIX family)
MGRIDYYDDPNAPEANSLVVGGSALVANEAGEILLQRRSDNRLWALPGGKMDIGESFAQAVCRETVEETGIEVEPVGIVGIYSDPLHVFAYDDGEVRQEFNICLACRPVGGELARSAESTQVGWFPADEIDGLDMHPSIRLRIRHFLDDRDRPYLG